MKKILSILLLAVGLVSCDEIVIKDNPVVNPDGGNTPEVVITGIEITGSGITAAGTVTLTVGTTLELAAEITPKPEKTIALVWDTSDEALLEITSDGQLEAKKAGTVKVTVSPVGYPDVSASITVTIVDAEGGDAEGGDEGDTEGGDEGDAEGGDAGDADVDAEVDVEEGTADQSKAEARG